METRLKTASELYALSQGSKCTGKEECHWCCAPCNRSELHDDEPLIPFVKKQSSAKRYSSPYVCKGCWLFRMSRITIFSLSGKLKDRQAPCNHSWLITEDSAKTIQEGEYLSLYPILLNPPLRFVLSLRTSNTPNPIHLQLVNDLDEIQAETELAYTLNGQPCSYNIYELEEGLKHGAEGKIPGVRTLINLLGPYALPIDEPKKKKRGRPGPGDDPGAATFLKRVVRQKEQAG